jgi:hypothetical protein
LAFIVIPFKKVLAIRSLTYALPGNYVIFGQNASFLCLSDTPHDKFSCPPGAFNSCHFVKIAWCKGGQYLGLTKALGFMILHTPERWLLLDDCRDRFENG